MNDIINTLLSVGLGAIITIAVLLLKPAPKEDARRAALHELEFFCPPNWQKKSVKKSRKALSRLYKELQYASRGRSFLITRAAVWKMIEILKNKKVSRKTSKELYIWKTVIACALNLEKNIPIFPIYAQKKFKKRLKKVVEHTKWVVAIYNNETDDEIVLSKDFFTNFLDINN